MLQLFLTKTMFRLSLLLALIMFIGVFVYAVDMDKYNVPPPDMQAPFKDSSAAAVFPGSPETDKNPLSVQNYSSREVSQRLTEIVAETLSFDKSNFIYNSGAMQKYFTPGGYKQYTDFISTAALQNTLTAQDLQSGAYAEQNPLELSSGVYNGVYKWLFEVPVTISFIPRDAETYRENATQAVNRRVLLHAQFTRVKDAADPNAIRLEIWQILPPRKTN